MAVGAPAALELKRVQIKHHHTPAQVIVGCIEFAGGLIEADLFDSSYNHRCRRRILGPESLDRCLPSGLGGGIGLSAATTGWEKSGDRSGAAVAWNMG